jgi:hypothetical protein
MSSPMIRTRGDRCADERGVTSRRRSVLRHSPRLPDRTLIFTADDRFGRREGGGHSINSVDLLTRKGHRGVLEDRIATGEIRGLCGARRCQWLPPHGSLRRRRSSKIAVPRPSSTEAAISWPMMGSPVVGSCGPVRQLFPPGTGGVGLCESGGPEDVGEPLGSAKRGPGQVPLTLNCGPLSGLLSSGSMIPVPLMIVKLAGVLIHALSPLASVTIPFG